LFALRGRADGIVVVLLFSVFATNQRLPRNKNAFVKDAPLSRLPLAHIGKTTRFCCKKKKKN
jgi:hypothetical protein